MRCIMLQASAPVLGLSRLGRGQLAGDERHTDWSTYAWATSPPSSSANTNFVFQNCPSDLPNAVRLFTH